MITANTTPYQSDIVRMNVPTFIRLLELAREDLTNDADIHKIAEIATTLSSDKRIITMADYQDILKSYQ